MLSAVLLGSPPALTLADSWPSPLRTRQRRGVLRYRSGSPSYLTTDELVLSSLERAEYSLSDTFSVAFTRYQFQQPHYTRPALYTGTSSQYNWWTSRSAYQERDSDERRPFAWRVGAAGDIAIDQGKVDQATGPVQEALALTEREGDAFGTMWARCFQGRLAHVHGNFEQAARLLDESLGWLLRLGSPGGFAMLNDRRRLTLDQGDTERAAVLFGESLRLTVSPGTSLIVRSASSARRGVAAKRGQPARAARLLGAVEATQAAARAALTPVEQQDRERYATLVRTQLDDSTYLWAAPL